MECYYSSDEEVAWGPLTFKEVKKELLEGQARKIGRRETDFGNFGSSFTTNKTTESEKSAYFTPEETINKNDSFLKKLSEAIDNEVTTTTGCTDSFTTALHSFDKRDTLQKILDEHNHEDFDVENIQENLVENTLKSPEVENDDVVLNSTIEEISEDESFSDDDDVVVISDDSFNCSIEEQPEQGVLVKVEANRSIAKDHPSNNDIKSFERMNLNDEDGKEGFVALDKSEQYKEDYQTKKNLFPSCAGSLCDELKTISNTSFEQQVLELSPESDNELSDIHSEDNREQHSYPSLQHNDNNLSDLSNTLDDIEMFLKEDCGYHTDSDLKTPGVATGRIQEKSLIPRKIQKTPNWDYIQSPVGDYIRKKSPKCDNFKLPLKPVKHKVTPAKSPLAIPKQFKSIVSPVGIYIKNSPATNIKQNVATKRNPAVLPTQLSKNDTVKSNKENIAELPQTMYRTPKKVVSVSEKAIDLPPSIKKLVPESTVAVHEKRLQKEKRVTEISDKLLEEDLTAIDSSLLNQSGVDISFINIKCPFNQ